MYDTSSHSFSTIEVEGRARQQHLPIPQPRKGMTDTRKNNNETEAAGTPSQPPKPRYKGMPTPSWFNDASADAFRTMSMRPNDVILSSMVKGGTTWVHRILYSLMHAYDDDGNKMKNIDSIGLSGQIYPDSLPVNREEQRKCLERDDKKTKMVMNLFGDYVFEDLLNQPEPRLFSTHLFGKKLLPIELLGTEEKEGNGRLVIVLRNLKDVLCSLHFFNGEPKDGWLGNEHGPGSYHRYLAEDCPNAFGSVFDWTRDSDEVVQFLQDQAAKLFKKERVLVLYYEALKDDLMGQLDRINDFLGYPPLTSAKRTRVAEACGFTEMKNDSTNRVSESVMRKGLVGDWRNHLDKSLWDKFDDVFARRLGDVALAEPLRQFH